MIRGSLTGLARALRCTLLGADAGFAGVSTDTRSLVPGQLFVALRGPRFDAHDFVPAAVERGAAAALVERRVGNGIPTLQVSDTLAALGAMANWWRRQFSLPVIALTGSFGKTTVKEMLAAIARTRGETLSTEGNLNNEIGVPLTLFRLGPEHATAVVEMGANHVGEIERLTAIARPDVGLVTVAGPAHLEGFGSLEGVARGKGEIFQGLPDDGVAVINADDPFAPMWREFAAGRRVVTFGRKAGADFSAAAVRESLSSRGPALAFELHGPDWRRSVTLHMAGRHNVMNALAAAAAAAAAGFDADAIVAGLEAARGAAGRLGLRPGPGGATIVDDTYNASPGAVEAAVDFVVGLPGEAWVVLGDMGELGREAEQLHVRVGRYAADKGVKRFFSLGDLSGAAARAFGAGQSFTDLEALVKELSAGLGPGVNVLVKGSRSMRMERVVERLAVAEGN